MEKNEAAGIVSVYTFDNLSEEAKEKARAWYRELYDYPELEEDMLDFIGYELALLGYDTADDLRVYYSLGYCQGDGVSFEGTITKGEETWEAYKIDHQYQHENTFRVRRLFQDGENDDDETMTEVCRKVCNAAAKAGYAQIDYERSDEVIDQVMIDMEYTFTRKGERLDADNV